MWSKTAIDQLARFYPPCGPCVFCGHRDKRHRLWDVLMDSPEGDEETAKWYGTTVDHVRAVRAIRPYRRGGELLLEDAA